MDITKIGSSTAAWFEIVVKYGEFDALVEPFGNKAYRKLYDKLTRPHAKLMRRNDGNLPPDILDPIIVKCMAETVWKGWKRLTDGDGNDVPYSVEGAARFLEDPIIREAISKAALQLSESYATEHEAAAGN